MSIGNLEKLINSIKNSTKPETKRYFTNNLIYQLDEFNSYIMYVILKSYELIMSPNDMERDCGSDIIKNLKIKIVIKKAEDKSEGENSLGNFLYLKSYDILGHKDKSTFDITKKKMKEELSLEHTDDNNFIDTIVDKEDVHVEKKLKTTVVKDKEISSIQDFYDNLTLMMLSSEWYKRHGAFITLYKIVNQSKNNEKGNMESAFVDYERIKTNCLIILKSDKFVDFKDDVPKAPVREEASKLINLMPMCKEDVVVIKEFLFASDWKEQVSGLLVIKYWNNETNKLLLNVEDQLIKLVKISLEEDVKMIAVEILQNYKLDQTRTKELVDICFNYLNDKSKTDPDVYKLSPPTILLTKLLPTILLEKDYFDGFKGIVDNVVDLISTFLTNTSFFKSIGLDFIVVLLKVSPSFFSSLIYLLGEYVLFTGNDRAVEILVENIGIIDESFIQHFTKICECSLYSPYTKEEFILQDHKFFTENGYKIIETHFVLNNRCKLFFNVIDQCKFNTKSLLTSTLTNLIKVKNGNNVNSTVYIDHKVIKEDYKAFPELKSIPAKELVNFINNPFYNSIILSLKDKALEYIRLCVSRNLHNNFDFTNYFLLENSSEMLKQMIYLKKGLIKGYNDSSLIPHCINKIIKYPNCVETKNIVLFLEALGPDKIKELEYLEGLIQNPDNIKFFANTSHIYLILPEFKPFFIDTIYRLLNGENEYNYEIVKNCILLSEEYNILFVLESLEYFNINRRVPNIMGELIDFVKPYLLSLYLKVFLRYGRYLLSNVISGISLKIDEELETVNPHVFRLLNESKNDAEAILNPKSIEEFKITENCKIELRNYQKEGIKWINFLFSFGLNGILADDMGLGKTVQVLAYLITKIEQEETDGPSLIVCPSTLKDHWVDEAMRHFGFNDVGIFCSKNTKSVFQNQIIVCSYDNVRRFPELLRQEYFLVVFDEGHILKNRTTQLNSKCAQLKFSHSLILTGTPVHNSVDDLYSLMNIIMPFYLGDFASFKKAYGFKVNDKNINSFLKGTNDKLVDYVQSKLTDLRKKVLPFIFRRLKSDVLHDLPPKIIRDITVEMTSSQANIYRRILSDNNQEATQSLEKVSKGYSSLSSDNPLKLIRNLLKAASHPMHFDCEEPSCKSAAVFQILDMSVGSKALIFFQNKASIDYFIFDIKAFRPDVTFNRLDSDTKNRYAVVNDFNQNSAVCLLSTTNIGGLGLNLTSANVVIFYEHDWNPFNDLQAMDRAHRLGQKKSVNVFRVLTADTIENKVMNLQNFKMHVASNLVSQQNTKIEEMDVENLLERFEKK